MINVKKFTFNMFSENTYVLWDEITKESAIIDPGCVDEYEEKMLTSFIETNELNIKYLINTHCHLDHVFGCKFIKDMFNPLYYIPEKELDLLKNVKHQAEKFGVDIYEVALPDDYLSEKSKLKIGDSELKILDTPGHTAGEICIYLEQEKMCITGDVLFKDSIGRTDLEGGNYNALIKSIKTKLLTLPDDTKIYPGHGDESTIFREKNYNQFLID